MQKLIRRHYSWIFYFIFVALAFAFGRNEAPAQTGSGHVAGKAIVWTMFIGFLGYSIFVSHKESFVKTLPKLNQFHWARQIGIDLYISMFFSLVLIWLVEGSVLVFLLWLVPVLIFANLAVLLYIALNYDSIFALLGM